MKIHPHPPVDQTIGQEPSSSAAPEARAGKAPTGFAAGQLLSGRVLSLESDGRVILDINGRTVTAYSAVQLPLGEKVEFVVSRGGDLPWLALKDEGPAQQLFRLLATDTIGQIVEKLDMQFTENLPGPQAQSGSAPPSSFASQLSSVNQAEPQAQSGSAPPSPSASQLSSLNLAEPQAQPGSAPPSPSASLLSSFNLAGPQAQSGSAPSSAFASLLSSFNLAGSQAQSGSAPRSAFAFLLSSLSQARPQAQSGSAPPSPFASLLSAIQVSDKPSLDNLLLSLLSFAPPKANKFTAAFIPQEKDLLQLLTFLNKSGPQAASNQGTIRQLVSLQQAFVGFNQQANSNLLFIVPLFLAGKSGWGEWLVRQGKEQASSQGKGGGAPLRFDFFLQLSNLGETQLALLVRDKNLQGTFFLEDGATVKHVAARLQELQDKLARLGFKAPAFSCRIKEQNNQLRLKKILQETSNTANLALVDLTA